MQGHQSAAQGTGLPFVVLNGAFAQDVACVSVPAGIKVQHPLHILYLSTGDSCADLPQSSSATWTPALLICLGLLWMSHKCYELNFVVASFCRHLLDLDICYDSVCRHPLDLDICHDLLTALCLAVSFAFAFKLLWTRYTVCRCIHRLCLLHMRILQMPEALHHA